MTALEFIKKQRFIVLLRHIEPKYIKKAARALYDGGARIFEVTFNPSSPTTVEDTQYCISEIIKMFGDEVSVGAGTVLSVEHAKAAYEAGAQFIVSPNTDEEVISYTKSSGMLSMPGAYTPTEVMNAYKLGADIVKIFPILPDGEAYLKNLVSPLSHIPFVVTGGVNPDTIEKFMKVGPVALAAGITMITKEMCEKGEFDKVTLLTQKHVKEIERVADLT